MESIEKLPLVSIVLNTRNRAKLLPKSISSALSQTYTNIELIVVDGESSDETKEVVKSFMEGDSRVKYLYIPENKSAAYCINQGFKASSGKYISILDDDDEYLPQKVEKQVQVFERGNQKLGIVYCWEEFWDDRTNSHLKYDKKTAAGNLFDCLLEGSCTGGGTLMMVRKEAIEKVGGYDESIRFGADYQFNLNISKYYEHDFVPEVLVKTHWYHQYLSLTTQPGSNMNYGAMIEYLEKILSDYNENYLQFPDKVVRHYKLIVSLSFKAKNYSNIFKYLRLTSNSNMSIGNKTKIYVKTLRAFLSTILKS